MRPGYKTTEFWFSLLVLGLAGYATLSGKDVGPWLALLALPYPISRGLVKMNPPPLPDGSVSPEIDE